MDSNVATPCSRCGAEIIVMTASEYLNSTDADLDFTLHQHHESQLAIMTADRAYACPTCGKLDRLPGRQSAP
jgi:DNA-directed RNA polymerase subunit RPC12/RpoP